MIYIALGFAVVGMVFQALFIYAQHKCKYIAADVLKGCASLCFVAIGILGLTTSIDQEFARLVLIGLILGACGDILLSLRQIFPQVSPSIFLIGVATFWGGHLLYLVALIPRSQNLLVSLIVGAVVAVGLLTWIFTTIKGLRLSYKIFGILYIGAISLMTAVAIGIFFSTPSTTPVLYAVGALLFTVSDVILIFNNFANLQKLSLRITNLVLYYIGQLLIAFSLFYI